MERAKLIVMVTLALVSIVIVLQNTEEVETTILFWSVTMPRALLLFGTSLVGFALGVLVSFFSGGRRPGVGNGGPKARPKDLSRT